jgi:hypothetical protein
VAGVTRIEWATWFGTASTVAAALIAVAVALRSHHDDADEWQVPGGDVPAGGQAVHGAAEPAAELVVDAGRSPHGKPVEPPHDQIADLITKVDGRIAEIDDRLASRRRPMSSSA